MPVSGAAVCAFEGSFPEAAGFEGVVELLERPYVYAVFGGEGAPASQDEDAAGESRQAGDGSQSFEHGSVVLLGCFDFYRQVFAPVAGEHEIDFRCREPAGTTAWQV